MNKNKLSILVVAVFIIWNLFSVLSIAEPDATQPITEEPVQETEQSAEEETAEEEIDYGDYFQAVLEMLKEKYPGEIDDEVLLENVLKAMFNSVDDYTEFYDQETLEEFYVAIGGKYEGIGAVLILLDKYVTVSDVFQDSPAELSGIIDGDRIVSVDGVDIVGYTAEEAAQLIRGEEGTSVVLGILRGDDENIREIEVVRGKVKINPVKYRIMNSAAYIKIESFNSNTAEYFRKAIEEIDSQGLDKIILDLRNNPGGELNQAVAIANYFVPNNSLITKVDFASEDFKDQEFYSNLAERKYKVAVLVNGMSASASEILTGAIQDSEGGVIIGTKTYGKAKVQNMLPVLDPRGYESFKPATGIDTVDVYKLAKDFPILPFDEVILGTGKITTGYYYTPNGTMIDEIGIMPDIEVPDPTIPNGINIDDINALTKTDKPGLNNQNLDVFNAEKILKAAGYDIATPDLLLDEKTFWAIGKFQAEEGLFPYGVLDFATQDALNDKLNSLRMEVDLQYKKAAEILSYW